MELNGISSVPPSPAWSRFVYHLLIATVGGSIIAFGLSFAIILVIGEVRARPLINGPVFAIAVAVGLGLGYLVNTVHEERIAHYIWVVPAFALFVGVLTGTGLEDLFTGRCAATECFYQIAITVPFYLSVTYSLGALIASHRARQGT